MPNNKRIVIIEGDAFDADAIAAIIKGDDESFSVYLRGTTQDAFHYECGDNCDAAMEVAILAWRGAVGDLPSPHPEPLPLPPVINEPEPTPHYWSDEKGRYYETYGGSTIYFDPALGNFIWNEGPPRRKNPLGPEASPILRVYVDEAGKPLEQQPI